MLKRLVSRVLCATTVASASVLVAHCFAPACVEESLPCALNWKYLVMDCITAKQVFGMLTGSCLVARAAMRSKTRHLTQSVCQGHLSCQGHLQWQSQTMQPRGAGAPRSSRMYLMPHQLSKHPRMSSARVNKHSHNLTGEQERWHARKFLASLLIRSPE